MPEDQGTRLPSEPPAYRLHAGWTAAIVALAALFSIVIPGLVANSGKVMSPRQVCEKAKPKNKPCENCDEGSSSSNCAPKNPKSPSSTCYEICHNYLAVLNECKQRESDLLKDIAGAEDHDGFETSFEKLGQVRKQCDDVRKQALPFDLVGFANSLSGPFYFIFYVFMGVLIVRTWKREPSDSNAIAGQPGRTLLALGGPPLAAILILCVVLHWKHDDRAMVLAPGAYIVYVFIVAFFGLSAFACKQRKWVALYEGCLVATFGSIYNAFTDLPVSWLSSNVVSNESWPFAFTYRTDVMSSVLECARSVVLAMLVARLWLSLYWRARACEELERDEGVHRKSDAQREGRQALAAMEDAAHEFERWQVNSALLAAAFMAFAYYDWVDFGVSKGTVTFAITVYTALADQFTWLATWALLSVEVVSKFRIWRRRKKNFITMIPTDADKSDLVKAVLEGRPVSNLQLFVVSITGGIAVVLPLLRLKG